MSGGIFTFGQSQQKRKAMKRYLQTALLAAALMGTATAFAGNVQTDYNHSTNFSQYDTYSWGKVKTTDPFYVTRVQNAVNQQLQAKGWTLSPSGGSVTVFATDNVHDQQEIQTVYQGRGGAGGGRWCWGGWGGGGGWGPSATGTTSTINQNVGNLVIDIF